MKNSTTKITITAQGYKTLNVEEVKKEEKKDTKK